jgi:hypothetical protein
VQSSRIFCPNAASLGDVYNDKEKALLYSFLTGAKLPERRPGGALSTADMRYGEGTGDLSKPPCADRIVPSKMLVTSEQCAEQGATMTRQNDRREGLLDVRS